MASPKTPRHKRLAVVDEHGIRSASTPPAGKTNGKLLHVPTLSPSRHSSPGGDRLWQGRHYADDLIPRRLTASPVATTKSKNRIRKRLPQYQSIDDAVKLLQNAKNVVVLTGAGISTSLDIPDFRSDDGFYSKLTTSIGLTTPEEFFSLDFFRKQSDTFWDHVRPLLPRHVRSSDGNFQYIVSKESKANSIPRYSKTHAFLALLQSSGKLLTNYTQNIDDLEYASGVKQDKTIKCHGSWDTATCMTCGKKYTARKYLSVVWQNGYPRCSCGGKDPPKEKKLKAKPKKRKRAIYEGDSDHSSDDGTTIPKSLLKPDITFFGEEVPIEYASRLDNDVTKADLLLVIGTSLKTRPVRTMIFEFAPDVPQIWINKDRFSGYTCDLPGVQFDIELLGECDTVVQELCRRAGFPLHDFCWSSDRKVVRPPGGSSLLNKEKRNEDKEQNDCERNGSASSLTIRDRNISSITRDGKTEDNGSSSVAHVNQVSKVDKAVPPSDIRIQSDLDAEWRWRFSKPIISPSKK